MTSKKPIPLKSTLDLSAKSANNLNSTVLILHRQTSGFPSRSQRPEGIAKLRFVLTTKTQRHKVFLFYPLSGVKMIQNNVFLCVFVPLWFKKYLLQQPLPTGNAYGFFGLFNHCMDIHASRHELFYIPDGSLICTGSHQGIGLQRCRDFSCSRLLWLPGILAFAIHHLPPFV